VKQSIHTHQYDNGLTLLVEPMPWLQSAAFAVSIPAGCKFDPSDKLGLASFACEMLQRGCGERDSRKFIEDLERLGVDSSCSVSNSHTYFGGAMPAKSLSDALAIYADLILRPRLPSEQLEDGRMSCIQEVRGIEDDFAQQAMIELRRRHFPNPLGRTSQGTIECLESITLKDIVEHHRTLFRPNETVIGIAGNVEFAKVRDHVGLLFADWKRKSDPTLSMTPAAGGQFHIEQDSSQTHIALAFPTVPYSHPDYFLARGMVGVLSDGMSSRLFTEVREKRGLCYSVFASMSSMKELACVTCYAGTTTERAQETLDVILAELARLQLGVEPAELDRLKIQIRSSLVMQQESSRSRAASMVGDWYHLGRVRTLDELNQIIQSLTAQQINKYLQANPPHSFDLVTLGKQPLELRSAVSPAST
jgi:predicted Zn-dependent peptidase